MKNIFILLLSVLIILILPITAVLLTGGDAYKFLAFPPASGYVMHPPFSFIAFALIAGFIILTITPPAVHILRRIKSTGKPHDEKLFPWWGYAGVCICLLTWVTAWTRLPLFHELQRWTFLPLWISYIIIINAFCFKRTGHSLLTDRTLYLLKLFPVSAAFWWIFEYLNRFTANWYYTGTGELTPVRYFLEATLAFSTVLPAVMSTGEFIKTFPRLYSGMEQYLKVNIRYPRYTASVILAVSGAALSLTAVFPDFLFPLLWVSPVVIILSLQSFTGDETFISRLSSGDWRPVVIYALASLLCGFFWEMWNIYSQAKWIYSIPFVHRFLIFEMPVLGYAGYLPFGIECAVVAGIFSKRGEEPWIFR